MTGPQTTPQLTEEQRQWVEQALDRVALLARRLVSRLPSLTYDELQSAGYEGLVEAALRYDPREGVPFRAFAHYRIRGAMIDAARRAAPEMRRKARAVRALQATQALLEKAQDAASGANTAEQQTLRERVAAAADLVAQTTTAAILSRIGPKDPELIAAKQQVSAEEVAMKSQLEGALAAVMQTCTESDRVLIRAIYYDGISMRDYAKQVGRNVSTISRQHVRVVKRLGELLQRELQQRAAAKGSKEPR
jgi:RNA polymerase sigma factor for flagellar operon FliA